MKKKKIKYKLLIFIVVIFIPIISFAHPGRLDSNGGHYDHSTGEYHYHSGNSSVDYSTYSTTNKTYDYSDDKLNKNIPQKSTISTNKENKTLKQTFLEFNLFEKVITIIFIIQFVLSILAFMCELLSDFKDFLIKQYKKLFFKDNNIKNIANTSQIENTSNNHSNYFYTCPSCGGRLQLKTGKYGKFIGCKNYPYCKYTKSIKYR